MSPPPLILVHVPPHNSLAVLIEQEQIEGLHEDVSKLLFTCGCLNCDGALLDVLSEVVNLIFRCFICGHIFGILASSAVSSNTVHLTLAQLA